jgi:uncharacterized RDD family membrane protein YckC
MQHGPIVTPEAVRLDFEVAGLASRALARLVDSLVQGFLAVGAFLLIGLLGLGDDSVTAAVILVLLVSFLILFGYPAISETWFRGRTVGKVVVGLRVVTTEGAPVRFRHAAVRSIFQLLDLFVVPPGGVAVVSGLLTARCQRVGDLVAGTFAVRERQAAAEAAAVAFPPPYGYEGYVASLDAAALDGAGYGRIRTFLLRAGAFTPEHRAGLAHRLAQPLAERLHHRPPPTVSPELFLYCMAAAYQQRHGGPVPPSGGQPPPPPPRPPGP